jgi:hypothetical protein
MVVSSRINRNASLSIKNAMPVMRRTAGRPRIRKRGLPPAAPTGPFVSPAPHRTERRARYPQDLHAQAHGKTAKRSSMLIF